MFRASNAVSAIAMITLLAATPYVYAQETDALPAMGQQPKWIRDAAIAPDGKMISFTYRGQVFVVSADGGLAVPITALGSYSHGAIWSPDSERLAFASNLAGSDDIYVSDFSGTLERLSWSGWNETPTSFTPNGRAIVYSAIGLGDAERSVQGALSLKPQLYALDTTSGRETLVLPNFALNARWNKAMDRLVYTYDPAGDDSSRQHRVAANARQLYLYDPASGRHGRVFAVDGVDRLDAVWSADDKSIYYLSEASGRLNVWQHTLGGEGETQLTFFEDAPVRDLSIAEDGTLVFVQDGRIYAKAPGAGEPQPISIMTLDQRANIDENVRITRSDEFTSSPDGQHFAMTAYGNVFLLDRAGNYRQITSTSTEERYLAFSPDGSRLVYAAQRDHQWGLYGVDLTSGDQSNSLAIQYKEEAIYVPAMGNAFQPAFSPDGSKLAFIADRREVKVLDLASGELTALFGPDDYNSSYFEGDLWFSWSPTSQDLLVRWRTLSATGLSRAAIVPADGSAAPVPVSDWVPDFEHGQWSVDGSQVFGFTGLYGPYSAQLHKQSEDVVRVFLSDEARQGFLDLAEAQSDDEGVKPQRYSLDPKRSERLDQQLTSNANVMLMYPLDTGLGMVLVSDAGNDNYLVQLLDLTSGEISLLQQVNAPGLQSISSVSSANVLDFKLTTAVLSVPVFDPNGISTLPLRMFTSINPDLQRQAAFEQAWADAKYHFYSSALEGRDWDAIGAKYRSYLGSIATNRELADLVRAMFGELSASHLFSNYNEREERLAGVGTHNDAIGAYFDYGYEGPGRRIAAILPGGPLDRAGLGIAPGDIITSINGTPVPEAGGIERLLDVNVGKRALIGFTAADGGDEHLAYVTPIEAYDELMLAKQRWRDTRREMVDRLSNGCVVYQYVPAMDDPSYLAVLGRLLPARGIAQAALIDVRSNGGGNLTRELVTLLEAKSYAYSGRDDGPKQADPSNRWVDSSAVLIDSFVYSDGTMFPQGYQDAGVGKVVGDVALNTGTYVSTFSSRVLPGYQYALPTLPIRQMDGSYYENLVITPDVVVPFDPNTAGIGVDPQLEAAVKVLMDQISDTDCRLPATR